MANFHNDRPYVRNICALGPTSHIPHRAQAIYADLVTESERLGGRGHQCSFSPGDYNPSGVRVEGGPEERITLLGISPYLGSPDPPKAPPSLSSRG